MFLILTECRILNTTKYQSILTYYWSLIFQLIDLLIYLHLQKNWRRKRRQREKARGRIQNNVNLVLCCWKIFRNVFVKSFRTTDDMTLLSCYLLISYYVIFRLLDPIVWSYFNLENYFSHYRDLKFKISLIKVDWLD